MWLQTDPEPNVESAPEMTPPQHSRQATHAPAPAHPPDPGNLDLSATVASNSDSMHGGDASGARTLADVTTASAVAAAAAVYPQHAGLLVSQGPDAPGSYSNRPPRAEHTEHMHNPYTGTPACHAAVGNRAGVQHPQRTCIGGNSHSVQRDPADTREEVATGAPVQLAVSSVATGTFGHVGDTHDSRMPKTQVCVMYQISH